MAYCTSADLLNGSIPLPTLISPDKIVNDAADEIDSKIGMRYQTPVDLTKVDPTKDPAVDGGLAVPRPVRLLLKRMNAALATGRLILAVASPQENAQLHAYGLSLVTEATLALDAIKMGDADLDGVDELHGDDAQTSGVPQISNLDPESQVEAFYNRVVNPDYSFSRFGGYGESYGRGR